VNVVCCQVEVSETGWSLVQGSPTECGVSECDREASTMRRHWPIRAVEPLEKTPLYYGVIRTKNGVNLIIFLKVCY
jgi:hypothetical protein